MPTWALFLFVDVQVTVSVPPPELVQAAEETLTVSTAVGGAGLGLGLGLGAGFVPVPVPGSPPAGGFVGGLVTGGQVEMSKTLTPDCGNGSRGPQMLPSASGPIPCVRCWKAEKSLGMGGIPGMVSSGWMISVGGEMYCPMVMLLLDCLVPPVAVILYSRVYLSPAWDLSLETNLLRGSPGLMSMVAMSRNVSLPVQGSISMAEMVRGDAEVSEMYPMYCSPWLERLSVEGQAGVGSPSSLPLRHWGHW